MLNVGNYDNFLLGISFIDVFWSKRGKIRGWGRGIGEILGLGI